MKRILMLTMLLMLVIGGAQSASAAPFAFGPAGFDDDKSLLENLETITGPGTWLMPLEWEIEDSMYVTLLAVGQNAINSRLYVMETVTPDFLSAEKVEVEWNKSLYGTLDDMMIFSPELGKLDHLSNYISMVLVFGDDFVFQPEANVDGLTITGLSYLIGLDLTGNGGVDAIISLSYDPLVPAAATPIPAAAWLMGSGVAGLLALRRRVK